MSVTMEQIQAGIIKYIDTAMAPRANGITKFMIYFFVPSIPKMLEQKIVDFKSMNVMPELFDADGNINLDEVYSRAKEAIKKSGKLFIPKINYFADEQDLDMLYNIIKNG